MSREISGIPPGIVFLGWHVFLSATSILSKPLWLLIIVNLMVITTLLLRYICISKLEIEVYVNDSL